MSSKIEIEKNCDYCDKSPSNKATYKTGLKSLTGIETEEIFYYNGLDRVDNTIETHTIANCVPCCVRCNLSKRDMIVFDYLSQIEKIYNNLKSKNLI